VAREPSRNKIKVLVSDKGVKVTGNTAGVDVEIQIAGNPAKVIGNKVRLPWYQRPIGLVMIAFAAGLAVAGAAYFLGWTGDVADKGKHSKVTVTTPAITPDRE